MPTRAAVRPFMLVLVIALVGAWAGGAAQSPATQPSAPILKVSGAGMQAKEFDAAAFANLPRITITAKDKDGSHAYEGVRVSDILGEASMKFGQSLRGERLADYLIAEAGDGYRVVFALPEIDPEFSDRVVMIAERCDGQPLETRDGPRRIVVSDEHKHARWVRNVVALTVHSAGSDDPKGKK